MDNDGADGHGRSNNRQKFSGQGYANAPKYKCERVSNPRPKFKINDPYGQLVLGAVRDIKVGVWRVEIVVDDEPQKRNWFHSFHSKDDKK